MSRALSAGLRRDRIALALIGALSACAPGGDDLVRTHDLADRLERATVVAEPGFLDLGAPEAGAHLREGWSYSERARGTGESFVWGLAPASALEFEAHSSRPLELRLTGRPAERRQTTVTVVLNGSELEALEISAGRRAYSLILPADQLRVGTNRLELRYSPVWLEAESWPTRENVPLAVAWFDLTFGESTSPGRAQAPRRTADGDLFIPFGVRLDYHLKLPPSSSLRMASLDPRGTSHGELAVELESSGSAAARRTLVASSTEEVRLDVGDMDGDIVRLSLAALPSADRTGSGLLLESPAIYARAPAPAEPAALSASPRPPAGRPNIVVYLVDTLRADHLGVYGYSKPISPNIDRFAAEATTFRRVIAQSSWTRPTVATIFTGLPPQSHQVNEAGSRLPEGARTLAEILRAAGYRTAGVVTNPNVAPPTHLGRGFDDYFYLDSKPRQWSRADVVNETVFRWLDARPTEPFFLYVHTMDPHDPYDPTAEYRRRFAPDVPGGFPTTPRGAFRDSPEDLAHLIALYDAEIAFNDHHFGRLLERLRAEGLYEDSLILFLSDHGEEFGEHGGWKHGNTLFRESVEVPLIVKFPGLGAGTTVVETAQQIDVLPTILDWIGLEPAASLPGVSLVAAARGIPLGERQAVSHLSLRGPPSGALEDGPWKIFQRRIGRPDSRSWTFDLASDRAEENNLATDRPVVTAYLAGELAAALEPDDALEAAEAELGEELESQLRALGYIN